MTAVSKAEWASASSYMKLIDAGAPRLPEPYFFRIGFDDQGDLCVQVRRHRKWWFSAFVLWRFDRYWSYEPASTLIERAARLCQDAWREAEKQEARQLAARSIRGDYP